MDLSLVIPAYNEADSLRELLPETVRELSKIGLSFEVIVADDASTDATPSVVSAYAAIEPRVHLLRLLKNSKKAGALTSGLRAARGDIIVTIDGDLQDDPANVALLMKPLTQGFDATIGWKRYRKAPFFRRVSSFIFNGLSRALFGTPFHDMNSGMKAYKRAVIEDLPAEGTLFRFGPVFLVASGWRVIEVPVMHRPRKFGASKFGTVHRCRGIVDMFRVRSIVRAKKALQIRGLQ